MFVGAAAMLLLVAGTAFGVRGTPPSHDQTLVAASQQASPGTDANENEPPDTEEAGEQLTDDHAAKLVELLKAQEIDVTPDQLKTLAAKYGVGGAVRLVSWAKLSGKTVDELAAMFDAGQGWGSIRKDLEAADDALSLSPGIGWIMGHGHGNQNANANHGQAKNKH
jgi:hypothetical protein